MRRVLLALLLLVAAACSDDGGDENPTVVRVLAAASLTDAFTEIGDAFMDDHDDVRVDFTFAASSALVTQIDSGAPASVLATADEKTMAEAEELGAVRDAEVFARNRLTLAVEPGNPLGLGALADLRRDDVLFALCAEAVPCGRLGAGALAEAGVDRPPATYAENARAVLTAVELGEVDAGLVYVTDVQASDGAVDAVEIDEGDEAVYPITVLAGGIAVEASQAFVDFVLEDEGQAILREHGFLEP